MRPKTIVYFERIFLATLALGVFQSWLNWEQLMEIGSVPMILSIQIAVFIFAIALVLLISRKRSRVAALLLAVMTVAGVPLVYDMIFGNMFGLPQFITLIQTACQLVAITLLCFSSSREWFKAKEPHSKLEETFS